MDGCRAGIGPDMVLQCNYEFETRHDECSLTRDLAATWAGLPAIAVRRLAGARFITGSEEKPYVTVSETVDHPRAERNERARPDLQPERYRPRAR